VTVWKYYGTGRNPVLGFCDTGNEPRRTVNRQQNIDYTESNERSQSEKASPNFSRSVIRLLSATESPQLPAS